MLEVRREILGNVHAHEVGNVHLTDLDAGSGELVPLFEFAFRRVVQLGDAIGGVASFPDERVINVNQDFVTRTDIELVEDERSSVVSEVGGRPVSSAEKVAIGAVGFRVGTRNSAGEATNCPLSSSQHHRARTP